MPTVIKTWSFTSDAEGLADAASNVNVTFAYVSADNAIQFTQATKARTDTEFARRATTGQSWQTWGVPAGATVTSIQVTAWKEKCVDNVKLTSHSLKARVIDSAGANVCAADLLSATLDTVVDASFQAGAAGTNRAVITGKQASTTDVRLELEYTVTTSGGAGNASVDQRFDDIELTITYQTARPRWGDGMMMM